MLHNRIEILLSFVCSLTFISIVGPGLVQAASLQLGWNDNSQDEDGFHVERKVGSGGTYALIATTGPNVTSYNDTNLGSDTIYCYRVNAFNSAGSSAYTEACATTSSSTPSSSPSTSPPPASSTLTAVLLGQTGEDIAGTTSETPDGIKDDHIRLNGVQSAVAGVMITDGAGCCVWQTPFNGGDWIVAVRPQTDPSVVDLYFDVWWFSSSYTVKLTFADGSSQTVQASTVVLSATQLSTTATVTTVLTSSNSSTANQSVLAVNRVAKIGDFRPDVGKWSLDRNGNGQWDGCTVDSCIQFFGQTGDLPVTKKINDLGETLIGIFRQGAWVFDSNESRTLDNCSADECNNFGIAGDLPVTGDWNGSGRAGIGVFRPSTGDWFLDMNGNGQWDECGVDKCFDAFGTDGDLPIVGDWNGAGQVKIGVYRTSTGDWLLDINGNGKFDGCEVDACVGPLRQPGGLPVVGEW